MRLADGGDHCYLCRERTLAVPCIGTLFEAPFYFHPGRRKTFARFKRESETMIRNQHLFACTLALILSGGITHAGPCSSGNKASAARDAGSGPTVGNTGQPTGTGSSNVGDPTSTMNRASGDTAASSQDAQP